MKMITKRKMFFFLACILISGISHAQSAEMTDYTWEDYSIVFRIPSDFTISESDSGKFIAGNDKINLSIYPRRGESLFFNGFKSALESWVTANDVVTEGEYLVVTDLNGFVGAMVDGTVDEYPVFMMAVANPNDLDVSLYVWISYDSEELSTAQDILYSIAPNE